jgi:hypothetical protein
MIIELTVDHFAGDQAVLKFKDKETASWPKSKLPADTCEGSVLLMTVINDLKKDPDGRALAKEILNEILDIKDNEQK